MIKIVRTYGRITMLCDNETTSDFTSDFGELILIALRSTYVCDVDLPLYLSGFKEICTNCFVEVMERYTKIYDDSTFLEECKDIPIGGEKNVCLQVQEEESSNDGYMHKFGAYGYVLIYDTDEGDLSVEFDENGNYELIVGAL